MSHNLPFKQGTEASNSPAKRLVEALQKEANVLLIILLCDVTTCWNSVYVMLQRCFEQKPAIKLAGRR